MLPYDVVLVSAPIEGRIVGVGLGDRLPSSHREQARCQQGLQIYFHKSFLKKRRRTRVPWFLLQERLTRKINNTANLNA
jgi:hypothetical protein